MRVSVAFPQPPLPIPARNLRDKGSSATSWKKAGAWGGCSAGAGSWGCASEEGTWWLPLAGWLAGWVTAAGDSGEGTSTRSWEEAPPRWASVSSVPWAWGTRAAGCLGCLLWTLSGRQRSLWGCRRDHRPHGRPWGPATWKPGPVTSSLGRLGRKRGLTIAQDGPAQAQGVCGPRTHVLYQPMLYFLQHWDQARKGLSGGERAAGSSGQPCPAHLLTASDSRG